MYKATTSFTTKNYDIRKNQKLADDFTTQEEIADFLNAGYIVEYDGSLEVVENGIYDVKDYETADVNVAGGGSGIDWTEIGYTEAPTSVTNGFDYAKTIVTDWENVENLRQKFLNDNNLKYMPLVDTSNATDMTAMFQSCKFLENIPVLNTSNVTNMASMFQYCSNLKTIPLLDTSNVTNMGSMFYYCEGLTSIPLLNTSNVTSFTSMFQNCSNLQSIPAFDTSNAKNFTFMFYYCTNLKDVPVLNTSKVTNMSWMFNECSNLTDESLNNILQMCINTTSAYTGAKNLNTLALSSSYYPSSKIQGLSNYQAFIDAGWSIGY